MNSDKGGENSALTRVSTKRVPNLVHLWIDLMNKLDEQKAGNTALLLNVVWDNTVFYRVYTNLRSRAGGDKSPGRSKKDIVFKGILY